MVDWRERGLAEVALDDALLLTVPDAKDLLMKRGVVSGQLSTVSFLPEHGSFRAMRERKPTVSTKTGQPQRSRAAGDHSPNKHTCEAKRSERIGDSEQKERILCCWRVCAAAETPAIATENAGS